MEEASSLELQTDWRFLSPPASAQLPPVRGPDHRREGDAGLLDRARLRRDPLAKLMHSASESGSETFSMDYFELGKAYLAQSPQVQADGHGGGAGAGVRDRAGVPRRAVDDLQARDGVHERGRGDVVDRLPRGRHGVRGGASRRGKGGDLSAEERARIVSEINRRGSGKGEGSGRSAGVGKGGDRARAPGSALVARCGTGGHRTPRQAARSERGREKQADLGSRARARASCRWRTSSARR